VIALALALLLIGDEALADVYVLAAADPGRVSREARQAWGKQH